MPKWLLSLDAEVAEQRFQAEPNDELSPDKIFDKRWAAALLEYAAECVTCLDRLRRRG